MGTEKYSQDIHFHLGWEQEKIDVTEKGVIGAHWDSPVVMMPLTEL